MKIIVFLSLLLAHLITCTSIEPLFWETLMGSQDVDTIREEWQKLAIGREITRSSQREQAPQKIVGNPPRKSAIQEEIKKLDLLAELQKGIMLILQKQKASTPEEQLFMEHAQKLIKEYELARQREALNTAKEQLNLQQ